MISTGISILVSVFTSILALSATAVTALLAGSVGSIIVIVTVAVSSPLLPSLIIYVKVVVPIKSASGVKITVPSASNVTVPFVCVSFTSVIIKLSPSRSWSLFSTGTDTGVLTGVD